jgi:hypothetical protein
VQDRDAVAADSILGEETRIRQGMNIKLAPHYIKQLFDITGEIGAAVTTDAVLYVSTQGTGALVQLTPDNIGQFLNVTYGFTSLAGPQHKQFVVSLRGREGTYFDTYDPHYIAAFTMYYFPGCCAMCVSTAARVNEKYRRRGINKLGMKLRITLAKLFNYSAMVCTDLAGNEGSIKTIEGAGFEKIFDVRNRRTANSINVYVKKLDY